MSYTDIKKNAWIVDRVPQAARPYAYLARLDRPIGVWLLLLPGLWSIMIATGGVFSLNFDDLKLVVLFGIGAVIMRAAGCIVNDLWDRELDRHVERTRARPIASGEISVPSAVIFLCALLLVGAFILFQMSLVTILLGILSLPLIALYPLMKRITWWPQFFLGITFNFGALMGCAAVTGVVESWALLLYLTGIFWTLGYDTIYAHQDIEDDMQIGIKSAALKLGPNSKKWIRRFFIACWLGLFGSFVLAGAGWLSAILLGFAGYHLHWQLRTWNPEDQASSLDIFKANRDFGLLVLLAAAL